MRKKIYRGFVSGNTFRRTSRHFHRVLRRRNVNETEGLLWAENWSDGYDFPDNVQPFRIVDFNGLKFHDDVPYSIKKHQRWKLPDFIAYCLENDVTGRFENHRIEVLTGHAFGNNGPKRKYRLDKFAGESEIFEQSANRGFLDEAASNERRYRLERKYRRLSDKLEGKVVHFQFTMTTAVHPKVLDRNPGDRVSMYERYDYDFDKKKAVSHTNRVKKHRKQDAIRDHYFENICDDDLVFAEDSDDEAFVSSLNRPNMKLEDFINAQTRPLRKRRRRRSSVYENTDIMIPHKNRKIYLEKEENSSDGESHRNNTSHEEFDNVTDLTDNHQLISSRFDFLTSELSPSSLTANFDKSFIEGASHPRKFAIEISKMLRATYPDLNHHECVRNNTYLVFEELRRGSIKSTYDVYLNADLEGNHTVYPLCPENEVTNLCHFTETCAKNFEDKYGCDLRFRPLLEVLECETVKSPLDNPKAFKISIKPLQTEKDRKPPQKAIHKELSSNTDDNGNHICGICFDSIVSPLTSDDGSSDIVSSGCGLQSCGHFFCNDCWRMHLIAEIRLGHRALRCPETECGEHVDMVTVLRFVSLPLYQQYAIRTETNVVDLDPNMVWCPAENCGRLIKLLNLPEIGQDSDVQCQCGHTFCFMCREEAHWPALCSTYKHYVQKMKQLGDVEALTYDNISLKIQGKNCPKCRKFIEKNGGCPQMSCVCGHDFCWVCGNGFEEDIHHDCYMTNDFGVESVDEIKAHTVADELTMPNEARSKDYSECIRWRLIRLHPQKRKDFMLHFSKLQTLVRLMHSFRIERSANDVGISYETEIQDFFFQYRRLLQIVEFTSVSLLVPHRKHSLLIKRIRKLAAVIGDEVVNIRDTVNISTFPIEKRYNDMIASFKHARMVVRLLEKLFREKATTLERSHGH